MSLSNSIQVTRRERWITPASRGSSDEPPQSPDNNPLSWLNPTREPRPENDSTPASNDDSRQELAGTSADRYGGAERYPSKQTYAAARKRAIIEIADDSDSDSGSDSGGGHQLRAPKRLRRLSKSPTHENNDVILARKLQAEEEKELKEHQERQRMERKAMYESTAGRAILLVEKVLQLSSTLLQNPDHLALASRLSIRTVGRDDMVFLAEKLVQCQADFKAQNKPQHVSLAYHYTFEEALPRIRQDGLLSKTDLQKYNNSRIRQKHGAYFGEGVYTGNNPVYFRNYGTTGLLVAIVKGREVRVGPGGTKDPVINTALGNKTDNDGSSKAYADEIILRESRQVLPLLRFSTNTTTEVAGHNLLWQCHVKLQKVVDEFLNSNIPTAVVPFLGPVLQQVSQRNQQATGSTATRGASHGMQPPVATAGSKQSASSTTTTAGSQQVSSGATTSGTVQMSAEKLRHKERFLKFIRVLLKYLETKDPGLHQQAKAIIKDCAERSKRQEKGYESFTASMRERFKKVVGEQYWKKAESYLEHFLQQKKNASALVPAPATPAAPAPTPAASPTPAAPSPAPAAPATKQPSSTSKGAGTKRAAVGVKRPTKKARKSSTTKTAQKGAMTIPKASPVTNNAKCPMESLTYVAPTTLSLPGETTFRRLRTMSKTEDCIMCLTNLRSGGHVVELPRCGCCYHKGCLEMALNNDFRCPKCRIPAMEAQGKCPSGKMIISHSAHACSGYEKRSSGSILLQYLLPSGTQASYHETPGRPFGGTIRMAFLPNNSEGRDLLVRLRYAWARGLTFTVGKSLTTGKSDQIVWSSIHHKSSMRGGVHGFPDPNYFANCNAELDTFCVPSSRDLIIAGLSREGQALLKSLESLDRK